MRRARPLSRPTLVIPLLIAGALADGHAGILEEASHETSLAASYTDTSGTGAFTRVDFQFQWISRAGRHEIGAFLAYENAKFDERPGGSDEEFNGLVAGPVYAWNWTPRAEHATGFLELSIGMVGLDLGDGFDTRMRTALGLKVFAGESASVGLRLFRETLTGEDGVDDLESTGVSVGVSFFTGRRPAP